MNAETPLNFKQQAILSAMMYVAMALAVASVLALILFVTKLITPGTIIPVLGVGFCLGASAGLWRATRVSDADLIVTLERQQEAVRKAESQVAEQKRRHEDLIAAINTYERTLRTLTNLDNAAFAAKFVEQQRELSANLLADHAKNLADLSTVLENVKKELETRVRDIKLGVGETTSITK